MAFIMVLSFFIVRLLLKTLGQVDYGIFSLISGFLTIFYFVSNSMASACQRFLAVEIGANNESKLNEVWNISLLIFVFLGLLLFLFGQIFAFFFFESIFNIPFERKNAAYWVYQFSVFAIVMTVLSIPFISIIIARERMNAYAIISLIDILLKLIIVVIIDYFGVDKLILYSSELFFVSIITFFIYVVYTRSKFIECQFRFKYKQEKLKQILSYSGWNLYESFSTTFRTQGYNVLLNLFYGPVMNASYGVAIQINNAISTFTNNLFTALKPQLIKNYNTQKKVVLKLAMKGSKYGFFLILLIALPVLFEMEYLFSFWLEEVPVKAVIFSRFIIINSIFDVISTPLVVLIQASGKIKMYQIIVGTILLFNVPFAYFLLNSGFSPESIFYNMLILSFMAFIPRLVIVCRITNLEMKIFFDDLFIPILKILIFALIFPFLFVEFVEPGFQRFLLFILSSIISFLFILGFATEKEDRNFLISSFRKRIKS